MRLYEIKTVYACIQRAVFIQSYGENARIRKRYASERHFANGALNNYSTP